MIYARETARASEQWINRSDAPILFRDSGKEIPSADKDHRSFFFIFFFIFFL